MTKASLPLLGVTIGDVAGIGPEITAKTLLLHPELRGMCRPVAVGDACTLEIAAALIGKSRSAVRVIARPSDATNHPDVLEVIQEGPALDSVLPGQLSATAGTASVAFVKRACALARSGEIEGIVTAPLNKEAMRAGGHDWPGHTELLAHEFGVKRFSLVLSAGDLYLFHITTHVSLRDAIELLTVERVLEILRLAADFSRGSSGGSDLIAVAGLNPHAGEHRLFGNEDADILEPAIRAARDQGINVVGPISADALMAAAVRGRYRFVVACYHDQGHAPFKAVYGDEGVNITVGLPVVRVSVDHGTAFDIAGQGIAREASLVLATRRAAELARGWNAGSN